MSRPTGERAGGSQFPRLQSDPKIVLLRFGEKGLALNVVAPRRPLRDLDGIERLLAKVTT
jgi:hypothetical protein